LPQLPRLFARSLQLSLKKGTPATLAMASRLMAALFRHALEAELARGCQLHLEMPRGAYVACEAKALRDAVLLRQAVNQKRKEI
jgi:hypothetical protein